MESIVSAVLACSAVGSVALVFGVWLALMQSCEPAQQRRASERPHLWTIHNRRYDMSRWVQKHPGGATMILLGRGRNCTELFESYHALSKPGMVASMLEEFYIEDAQPGDLDYDETFDWARTPFYDAVKSRVRAYFKARGISHKAGVAQRAQLGTFVLLTAVAYVFYARGSWLAMALLPVFYWLGPSGCMHDGAHSSIFAAGHVNDVVSYAGSAHMSIWSWNQQHTIGHHMHTNIATLDPDLYHFSFNARDGIPGFRTSAALKPLPDSVASMPRALFWRIGLLLRATLTTLGPSYIWDIISFSTFAYAYLGIVPYTDLTPRRLLIHIAGRVLVAWLCFTCPLVVMSMKEGLARGIVYAVAPYLIHGVIFYIFSQVSHVQAACFPKRGGPHGPQKTEWAVHQVEHTLDYATTSRLWLHLSGGLNNQVAHHLFPGVGWDHHDAIAPIIESTCTEFNVEYHVVPTFGDALLAHLEHLEVINDAAEHVKSTYGTKTPKEALEILGET